MSSKSKNPPPLMWSWAETCARLGVSKMTGERHYRKGDWPPMMRIGKLRFARPADVEAWIAEKIKENSPKPKRDRSEQRPASA
jgi:predicted DNA-binding transcriptional regulator AlpA